jgi:glycosyltransferase involved in cell wall biosynthesis
MSAVVQVCDYAAPYAGNFIASLLATGDAVRERLGRDYVFVFPEPARGRPWIELLRARGYKPCFIPPTRTLRGDLRPLLRIAADARAELIQTHFTRFDLPAGLVGRRLGAKVIWTSHMGTWNHTWQQRLRRMVKARVLAGLLCDRVVAVSEEIGRESKADGYPSGRISVVLNGIDISRLDQLPDRAEARANLGLRDGEPAVLAFCWSPFRKGADLIIAACAQIGATALLVGADELRAALPNLPGHVQVIEPREDPRGLFAAADVFASASREEAFSYAIGEAMAARLPVVSSRIPGPAAYFEADGVETFQSGDPDDLANALREFLDPAQRRRRGNANRIFVAERLGLDRHVEQMLAVIEAEFARVS